MFYNRNYVHKSNLFGVGILAFVVGAVSWAVFGKKITDELANNPDLRRLKKEVYDKASQISELTREKYDQVVDEVVKNYGKAKGISDNELQDLVADLKMHWGKIKNAWQRG